MPLDIKPTTQQERAQIYIQTLLNNTDLVTKVSDQSVLNAHSQATAKLAGKAEKDIFLALTTLFPDNTYGAHLDTAANLFGIADRFGASQSSTYLRLVGAVGTVYTQGVHTFSGKDGLQFELESTATIGLAGFTYAKVRSLDSGLKTNVQANTINKVSPVPAGHQYVVNEYRAIGGRDYEDDLLFRSRIKEGSNILATGTLSALEQAFMKINPNVLRVYYQGLNEQAEVVLAIATQNGIDLNASELAEILDRGSNFFSMTQLKPYGRSSYGIELKNIEWQPIDVSFRCELLPGFNSDEVRKEIQIKFSKYLDHRIWKAGSQSVQWDTLLEIVKNTKGMKYVPDQNFFPNNDVPTDRNKLPRIRGFMMLNLVGVPISSLNGVLSPVYYPQLADFSYQQTVLVDI